jgi:hypothetical protein
MERYIYLLAAICAGVAVVTVILVYQKHRIKTDAGRSWIDYLLLWPLVLDADKEKRQGRLLTTREWFGWGVVILVMILAIIFVPSHRGG